MPTQFKHSQTFDNTKSNLYNELKSGKKLSDLVSDISKIKDCYKYFDCILDASDQLDKFLDKTENNTSEDFKSMSDDAVRNIVNQLNILLSNYKNLENFAKNSTYKKDMVICTFFYLAEEFLENISNKLFKNNQLVRIKTFELLLDNLKKVKAQRTGTETYYEGGNFDDKRDFNGSTRYREGGTGLE